jgi:hypothetical protein
MPQQYKPEITTFKPKRKAAKKRKNRKKDSSNLLCILCLFAATLSLLACFAGKS